MTARSLDAAARSRGTNFRWDRWLTLAIFLLALLPFVPSLANGFIWDDDRHVTGNAALRSLDGLYRMWFVRGTTPQYYPLVFTLFWIEFHLFGLTAAGYHAVNLLLHGANAVLLWRLLGKVGLGQRAAFLAAALWALHPVQVETVDWIMEQKNLLSTTFYFLSGGLLLRLYDFGTAVAPRRWWRVYAAALLLFVAALLSKSVTATLPAAFLLILWWRRGRITLHDILRMVPFFVVGALSGLSTAIMEQGLVGTGGQEWTLSPLQRLLLAGRAAAFYAGKLVWPWRLTFFYEHWDLQPAVWWQWLFPLVVLAVLAILVLLHRRIGRGPAAAFLFFVGTLFPALGFLNVYPFRYSFVADHFQYVACAGLLTLIAALLAKLPRAAFVVVAGLVLLLLGVRTAARCRAFRDASTLYRDVIAQDPQSWVGHGLLGNELEDAGDPAAAASHYAAATRLAPDITENFQGLAHTFITRGQPAEARRQLAELSERPNLTVRQRAMILSDLGDVQAQLGERTAAQEAYREAIALFPRGSLHVRFQFGRMLAEDGRLAEAEAQFAAAIELAPESSDAQLGMGVCLARENRLAEALPYFQRAVAADPDNANARLMLARAHQVLGR